MKAKYFLLVIALVFSAHSIASPNTSGQSSTEYSSAEINSQQFSQCIAVNLYRINSKTFNKTQAEPQGHR